MSVSRRSFFTKVIGGAAVGLASTNIIAKEACKNLITPAQPEGPFYPINLPEDTDADLTKLNGNLASAEGEVVIVKGVVADQDCKPIPGAIVEVWQACKSGKYNHPSDTSAAKLDPNFQYYAMIKADSKGRYSFKTIIPGEYRATQNWIRPPHIHYKVSLRGYHELITQLYFKGYQTNRRDNILQSLSRDEQNEVVVDFKKSESNKIAQGVFNIKLESL